ncbi:MAG: ComF family protein [Nitrospirae bacterium]|nr:ComF family protein [Nitrospirota bacterium]MBI3593421.1 ComF family protein [Nitrospirota bacterium]
MKFGRWTRHFLELFFPAECQACKKELGQSRVPLFCEPCWSGIRPLEGPFCPQCGRPFLSSIALSYSPGHRCGDCRATPPYFDQMTIPFSYEGTLAKSIYFYKYRRQVSLIKSLVELVRPHLAPLKKAEVILPVPLHPTRLREREFNQSLLLADALGLILKRPVWGHVLVKVSQTTHQVKLSGRGRRKNLDRSLTVPNPKHVSGKTVLLVDDVFTTGSTMNECAKVLKKVGSQEVYGFAIARTRLKEAVRQDSLRDLEGSDGSES